MNRRELLEVVAVTGLAGVTAAQAADPPVTGHEHHDHAAMIGKYGDLVAATSHCVNKGETCIAHCLTLLGDGEKELAACAKTVQDVTASCTALRQLAAANSPHARKWLQSSAIFVRTAKRSVASTK